MSFLPQRTLRRLAASVAALAFLSASARAADPALPAARPVPRFQAVPQPHAQVSFQRDGVEIARYHYGDDLHRPFVFPVIGPSGRSLTRMGHPRDPESHSHHNSVWLSHQFVNGVNFWSDRPPGPRIAHQRMVRMDDADDTAFVETENAWLDKDGKPLLRELRRTSVQALAGAEWLLVLDVQFETRDADVTLDPTPFGMLGVRMAKTIGVQDGGGTIRNSEGGVDEAGCFRKPARWCDYSGPITPSAIEGITLLDHPMNPHHPVPFHVRDDGWMGAALTFAGPLTIKPGEPLRLRYGLYVHAGLPSTEALEQRWREFSKTAFPEFVIQR